MFFILAILNNTSLLPGNNHTVYVHVVYNDLYSYCIVPTILDIIHFPPQVPVLCILLLQIPTSVYQSVKWRVNNILVLVFRKMLIPLIYFFKALVSRIVDK